MDKSLRTRTCPAWPGCGGGAPRRSWADHGAGRGVASGARLGSAVRSSGWPECPECRGGTMLGVVHFLRSFFKVRDVGLKAGFAGRVLLGAAEGTAALASEPWAVCGVAARYPRTIRDAVAASRWMCWIWRRWPAGVWPWELLGRKGKEAHRDDRLGRGQLHRGWRDCGEPGHSWVSHGLGWVAG